MGFMGLCLGFSWFYSGPSLFISVHPHPLTISLYPHFPHLAEGSQTKDNKLFQPLHAHQRSFPRLFWAYLHHLVSLQFRPWLFLLISTFAPSYLLLLFPSCCSRSSSFRRKLTSQFQHSRMTSLRGEALGGVGLPAADWSQRDSPLPLFILQCFDRAQKWLFDEVICMLM